MAIYRTVTGDLEQITGGTYRSLRITVWHNVLVAPGLVDYDATPDPVTYLPSPHRIIPTAGDRFTVSLIDTTGIGTNVTGGSLRWTIRITWIDASGTPQVAQIDNFRLTADTNFVDLAATADPPATTTNLLLAQMQALLAEAEAITGITTTDSAIKALIDFASGTRTSLDARYGLSSIVRIYTTFSPLATRTATWTKPTGLKAVDVTAIGGGGGGGSGRVGAAGTGCFGGGGGQGGGFSRATIPATLLGATESIVIGAGGAGGAGVLTTDTSGNNGGNGATSSFGAPERGGVAARHGGGGSAGTGGSGLGGTLGGGSLGGSSSVTANAGDGITSTALALGAGGGGAGGGISSSSVSPTAYPGGLGGGQRATWPFVANTALGATPSAAAANAAMPGLGGPGGSASLTAHGGNGIAGSIYGGGGGGGAGARNGFNSGVGGNGAPGIVIVIEHY